MIALIWFVTILACVVGGLNRAYFIEGIIIKEETRKFNLAGALSSTTAAIFNAFFMLSQYFHSNKEEEKCF